MEIEDGRGKNMIELKTKNIEEIKNWFIKNPKQTALECSKQTGISYKTVLKHIKEIKGL